MSAIPLRVMHLEVHLHGAPQPVVGPLEFELAGGGVTALVGESGSGKTLTLRALLGLLPAGLHARVDGTCDGVALSDLERVGRLRGTSLAMVFQDPGSFFQPRWRIGRSLREVARLQRLQHRVLPALKSVGLDARAAQLFPHQMSGGMLQRAALAMALLVRPRVLLADEMTSALDPGTREDVLRMVREWAHRTAGAVLVVSHDIAMLERWSDHIMVMYGGLVVERGDTAAVLRAPRHRYTQALLLSMPSAEKRGRPLNEIPGFAPAAGRRVNGCPFVPRCDAPIDQCAARVPGWVTTDSHGYRCFNPHHDRDAVEKPS